MPYTNRSRISNIRQYPDVTREMFQVSRLDGERMHVQFQRALWRNQDGSFPITGQIFSSRPAGRKSEKRCQRLDASKSQNKSARRSRARNFELPVLKASQVRNIPMTILVTNRHHSERALRFYFHKSFHCPAFPQALVSGTCFV
jgi:hypothetical protein